MYILFIIPSSDSCKLNNGDKVRNFYSFFTVVYSVQYRGRILGHNLDKNLKSFPPYAIHSHVTHVYKSKTGWKLVCYANIVYRNLKSEISQEYAQKSLRNCPFINRLQYCEYLNKPVCPAWPG